MTRPGERGTETIRIGEGVEGWVIEFTPTGDHWLDFKAWEVVGFNGPTEADGLLFGDDGRFETERTDTNLFATGFIKWDGCSEWRWPSDDWHICGVSDALNRVALFRGVYDYAAKHYPPSSMSRDLEWPKED